MHRKDRKAVKHRKQNTSNVEIPGTYTVIKRIEGKIKDTDCHYNFECSNPPTV